jgi:hypothetical protein
LIDYFYLKLTKKEGVIRRGFKRKTPHQFVSFTDAACKLVRGNRG